MTKKTKAKRCYSLSCTLKSNPKQINYCGQFFSETRKEALKRAKKTIKFLEDKHFTEKPKWKLSLHYLANIWVKQRVSIQMRVCLNPRKKRQ